MKTQSNIVLSESYEELSPFVRSIDESFGQLGELVYKERNEIRKIRRAPGIFPGEELPFEVNVKRYVEPHFPNNFIYRRVRPSKAERAFVYGGRLIDMGIPTPEPLAYLLVQTDCILKQSYLLTRQSQLTRNMYEFGHSDLNGREDIVRALAFFAADVHEKGVLHLDFSPGNILFDEDPKAEMGYRFELVDINRLRFTKVSLDDGCKNLQRLWGRIDFLNVLSDAYAEARQASPILIRNRILAYHADFWKNRRRHF